jgi:hypothetical protein
MKLTAPEMCSLVSFDGGVKAIPIIPKKLSVVIYNMTLTIASIRALSEVWINVTLIGF